MPGCRIEVIGGDIKQTKRTQQWRSSQCLRTALPKKVMRQTQRLESAQVRRLREELNRRGVQEVV